MPRRRRALILFAPVPVMLFLLLAEAVGIARRTGDRLYDLFLRIEPPPPVARELLLVDVDDRAIATTGAWPWSRDVLADGVVLMRELGAQYALFDTPFSGRAPLGVDRHMLREDLPAELTTELDQVRENVETLFDAIRRGSIRPADSPRYVAEIVGLISAGKTRLLDAVTRVERDSDLYLGQAMRLFGNAFLAVELDASRAASPPSTAELLPIEHFALPRVAGTDPPALWARSMFLPAPPIAQGAHGGGYREIPADPDGVVRRARLLATLRGETVGQVAFAAAFDRLGRPRVTLSPEEISFTYDGSPSAQPLVLPLTAEGEFLIDWPHANEGKGLRRLSWLELSRASQLESDLVASLREMDQAGYLLYYRADPSVLALYSAASRVRDEMLASGESERLEEWREARGAFFALADAFLSSDVDTKILADAQRSAGLEGLTDDARAANQKTLVRAPELFREARAYLAELTKLRASLRDSLADAFCVVSVSGASAPAAGTTPLGRPTTAGEASAALANAILTGRSFQTMPRWYSLAAAGLLGLALAAALIRARPLTSLVAGTVLAAATCAAGALVLVLARIVADPTVPAACALLEGILVALVKVRQERADRSDW